MEQAARPHAENEYLGNARSIARPWIAVGLAAAIGICLSIIAFWTVKDWEKARIESALQRAAEARVHALQESIDVNLEVIYSLVSLFDATEGVDRFNLESSPTRP